MAEYTRELATEYNFPNIEVYRKLEDGVHYAWHVNTVEGYVMYDTTDNYTELDPETMEEIPVTYYYTEFSCPINYNFDNFTWIAVLREDATSPSYDKATEADYKAALERFGVK